ncbi:hypothetical protein GQ457_04G015580 [Hibiscus cannabinus]
MSIVPVQSALQPSVAVNNSRPDADPPDPSRHNDPMSVSLVSDMEVSSPDVPAPTLDLPDPALHDTPPVSSSPSPLLSPNPAPLSYKDKLMASDPPLQVGVNTFFDAEEVTLVEGDVTRSTVDGLISIVFSERVQALAVKNFDLTVVVKLLGRRIGYNTLRQRLLDIWKPTEAFRLMDIENDYYLVTFKSHPDYSKAVSGGPWVLFGHYLVVEPWTVDFSASQSHPNRVMAWIRLPGLPVTLYQRSIITAIGECIGPVIKIDYQTESGCRGRFARMAVSLDLRKPLVSKLFINGRLQVVEYESLPTICFECGKYGHVKDVCPVGNNAKAVDTTISVPPVIDTPPMTNEAFGLWMKVERRQRRVVRNEINTKHDGSDFVVSKSRFNPIFEDETVDELTDRPTTVAFESHSKPDTPGLSLPAATDSRGKGKVPVSSTTAKNHSPTSVRKPLVVQRPYAASSSKSGPLPSRRNSSLSNTRFTPFPRPPTRLNKGNHSAVVVSESDDPVILSDSATSLRVRDPSVDPLVPNTLIGAVKPPNLVEGHVQSLVQPIIVAESHNAPSMPALPNSNFLVNLEHELQLELENLLDQEELIWRQMSRIDWISQGDRNTSYFHRKAKQRKIRNHIVSLQLPDGTWCDDEQVLRTQAASFFWSLFSDPDVSSGSYSISDCFPPMPRPYMDSLAVVPLPQEVRDALCSMAPLKAPGPDGLHAEFYQKHWHIVGNDIYRAIRLVFEVGNLEPDLHRTTMVSVAARAPRVSIVSHLQWLPPAPGCVSLNTDASLSPTTGVGMIGGVLRDSSGAWITGFQKCVGIFFVLQAELWSVLIGLQVARSSGVDRILVQELNMVADCLAKLSSPSQFNLLVSTVIPAQVQPLLDRDREGPPYIRHSRGVT